MIRYEYDRKKCNQFLCPSHDLIQDFSSEVCCRRAVGLWVFRFRVYRWFYLNRGIGHSTRSDDLQKSGGEPKLRKFSTRYCA